MTSVRTGKTNAGLKSTFDIFPTLAPNLEKPYYDKKVRRLEAGT
ncbi:hypothetical protein [Phormidium nigroviride]